jgi:hypothetical protein
MADSYIVQPLVIMSISDHYTRIRYIEGSEDVVAVGILIGQREGASVKIFMSFETVYDLNVGTIDTDFSKA